MMSVVWASDSGCCEWGNEFNPFHRKSVVVDRRIIPDVDTNKDGYMGNPTSFIDINDPKVSDAQKRYEDENRKGFRKNMGLVSGLIRSGVVMPTEKMLVRCVDKLRKIANGEA